MIIKFNNNDEYEIDLDASLSRLKRQYDADPVKKQTDRMIRIIRLRYVNKMTFAFIAKDQGISLKSAKNWTEKGERFLRLDMRRTPWSV
jgi:hypothetical protein